MPRQPGDRITMTRTGFRSLAVALGLAAALTMGSAARAATALYDFVFTAGNLTNTGDFSGQFTVNTATNRIVGITGSGARIGSITALLSPGGFAGNDNAFSPTAPYLTFDGVSFTTSLLGNVNLFFLPGFGSYRTLVQDQGARVGSLSVTPASVPAPASAALLVAGLAGLAAFRRRRPAATPV
jgi:hypothetical protein